MAGLVSSKLESFFFQFKPFSYRKGEIVLRPDDITKGVFYIKKGYVRMNSLFEDGRELTLNIFKPGSFFPMMWAISDLPNNYYFQTMTITSLKCAPKNTFLNFIKSNPEVLFDLTKRILIGLNGLLSNAEYLLTGDSYHRVIAALFLSAKRFGQKHGQKRIIINLPLTHQDIANIAGITRETVSIAMKQLQRKGLISYSRHSKRLVVINNLKKLEKESLIQEGVK